MTTTTNSTHSASGISPASSASQPNADTGEMGANARVETTSAPQNSAPAQGKAAVAAKPKTRTPGWKLFDVLVYGVINFGGNIAASFYVASKLYDKNYTGRPLEGVDRALIPFDKAGNFLQEKVFRPVLDISLQPKHADGLTKLFSSILALSWGGTLLLVPVKILENNKPKIVRAFDTMIDSTKSLFGTKISEKELAAREETYKLLDSDSTKKTWKQAIGARVYSVFVVVFGAMGLTILLDPKARGIERIADAWRDNVSPEIRKYFSASKLRDTIAPLEELDMQHVKNAGGFQPYVEKLANDLTANNPTLSPAAAAETALGQAQKLYRDNKPAWNVSNMTVELVGSAITAGTFYVKLMFDELFRKTKLVGNLADNQATAPAAPPHATAETAPETQQPTPAVTHENTPTNIQAVASAAAAVETPPPSRFTDNLNTRDSRSVLRLRAEQEATAAKQEPASHVAQVQSSRDAVGEHSIV